jgi:hypothetical protein
LTVKRPASPIAAPSLSEEADEQRPAPNLVNKQMVLPFIPPRFPNTTADSNSLIKPSEYLRSLGGNRLKTPDTAADELVPDKTETPTHTVASAPVGPPPPPLPTEDCVSPTAARKQQQPLGAISIQDLNSVQLRRTDKMLAAKTLSAPPRHTGEVNLFLFLRKAVHSGKHHPVFIDRRLGGPKSQYGTGSEKENLSTIKQSVQWLGYGLDDKGSVPDRSFSRRHRVQTSCGAHLAS